MVTMKNNKKNKFGVRAILSTVFGELTDSIIFVSIAFIGNLTFNQLITMIITQVVLKSLYEIICLPITVKVVKKVEAYEK